MAEQSTTLQRIAFATPRRTVTVEEAARTVGLNRYQARMYRRILLTCRAGRPSNAAVSVIVHR